MKRSTTSKDVLDVCDGLLAFLDRERERAEAAPRRDYMRGYMREYRRRRKLGATDDDR